MDKQATQGFEGSTSWFILDTANPPVPTIGVGHACPSLASVLSIPPDYWAPPSGPSTSLSPPISLTSMLSADWERIRQAPGGHLPPFYAPLTYSRLTPTGITSLFSLDSDRSCRILRATFPFISSLPPAWQDALDDMAFNLGPTFLRHWPLLLGHLQYRDPVGCQKECIRILSPTPLGKVESKEEERARNAGLERNKWTVQQFAKYFPGTPNPEAVVTES